MQLEGEKKDLRSGSDEFIGFPNTSYRFKKELYVTKSREEGLREPIPQLQSKKEGDTSLRLEKNAARTAELLRRGWTHN